MGRRWSDLLATVEHPRRPDPVGPRATLHEGCLVDMAGEDNVGLVCLDPGDELGVAVEVLAVPACRRAGWRRVVDPYPGFPRLCGVAFDLGLYCPFGVGAVPPRTDRDQRAAQRHGVPVSGDAHLAHLVHPPRNLFAGVVSNVEVVVARRHEDPRASHQTLQIL